MSPLLFAAEKEEADIPIIGLDDKGFMTEQDLLHVEDVGSGLTLENTSGGSLTVTGFYIQEVSGGTTCDTGGGTLYDGPSLVAGGFWTSVTMANNATQVVGKNFLYNVMANLLFDYYTQNSASNANYTPGENKVTGGTSWCIQIGLSKSTTVIAPMNGDPDADRLLKLGTLPYASSCTSSVVCPIPISCDDSTQTCQTTSSLTQAFPVN